MKAIKARITKGLQHGSKINTCDNSGAKLVKLISVKGAKTVKNRMPKAGIGDLINVSVVKGKPDIRKQVMYAIIVRQKKEFRRPDGIRVQFEDNAVVLLKDDKGAPKGTIFKGAIAKEAVSRWPGIAKIAKVVV